MASYGTVRTYAQLLGETNVARMLQRTLDEERAADLQLTQIAEASVNEAAAEWQAQEEDDGLLSRAAAAIGLTRPASKSRSSKVPRARTSAHKRVAARRVAKKR